MRCGEEFYEEGSSPTCAWGRAPGRSGKVPVNQNIPTCQRNTQYVRLTCVTTIVVTRIGFEWGSLRDVLDWTFMGYFMEETVTELL